MRFKRTAGKFLLASALTIPLLVGGLTACASDAPEERKTSAGGGTSHSKTDDALMKWQIDYAECMRGEGVDVPDPKDGGGGLSVSSSAGDDPEVMEAADEKCMDELGDPPPASKERQAAQDAEFMKFAKEMAECYREHGYDVPDPSGSKSLQMPADAPAEVQEECGMAASVESK